MAWCARTSKNLARARRPLTGWENFLSISLAWWVVPFTLLAYWLRFLPMHDWRVTTLHGVLIAGAAWFGVYSYSPCAPSLQPSATPMPTVLSPAMRAHLDAETTRLAGIRGSRERTASSSRGDAKLLDR
jgi:hypothetical protein